MSSKAGGLKSAIDAFIHRRGIEAGMVQNLIKEAIHLHLLSALSEAGVLQHVILREGRPCAFAMAASATARTLISYAARRAPI
jgi:hypothetical protein